MRIEHGLKENDISGDQILGARVVRHLKRINVKT